MANACRHIQRDLLLFLDGDLPDRDAARIREHLDGCRACRAEMEVLAGLWKSETTRPEPPSDAWPRLLARMASERSFWTRWRRECSGYMVPAFRIAGVIAAIWLGVLMGSRPGVQPASPDSEAEMARVFFLDAFDMTPPASISRIGVE